MLEGEDDQHGRPPLGHVQLKGRAVALEEHLELGRVLAVHGLLEVGAVGVGDSGEDLRAAAKDAWAGALVYSSPAPQAAGSATCTPACTMSSCSFTYGWRKSS